MISPESIVVIDLDASARAPVSAEQIAAHTANTWQPTRSDQEKHRDTQIGKLAEWALERFLARMGVPYRSWDDLRADDFRQHAPLDGFLAHPSAANRLHSPQFAAAAQGVQADQGSYGRAHFRSGFQQQCEARQIYGVEVKATRVRSRHLADGVVDYERILGDDFLVYPPQRRGRLTPELRRQLLAVQNVERTVGHTPYFLVRIYVEETPTAARAHLVGYTTRADFFGSSLMTVKSMPRRGKSEEAIYYAVGLRSGQPMRSLTLHLQQLSRASADYDRAD